MNKATTRETNERASTMPASEIELNSLIGHPKKDPKKTDEYNEQRNKSGGMNLCHVFLGFAVLLLFFGVLKYDEKTHGEDENNLRLGSLTPPPKPKKSKPEESKTTDLEGSNCVDDPDFRFEDNPERDCKWVEANCCGFYGDHSLCGKGHIYHHCPKACGQCIAKEDTGLQILDGVDDNEVYCEDLSRYDDWHGVTVTLDDGVMYQTVEHFHHDRQCFTQGLTYGRGKLFESGGLYRQSSVRILDRNTADVEKKVAMGKQYFAEGMTYYKDKLVQITWQSRQGFVYNMTTLEQIDSFKFATTLNEGWGITWDRCKDQLIVTDGSANLHFWNPRDMTEVRRVKVTRQNGKDATNMNEIEFWRGRVLANVWYEDVVLVINPETGVVEKEYDFSKLYPKQERRKDGADVLNGISISEDSNILYFTGKKWNRMYKIKLLPELE